MDKILKIGRETAEAAVLGGSVLGGGCQEEAGWVEGISLSLGFPQRGNESMTREKEKREREKGEKARRKREKRGREKRKGRTSV